MMKFLIQSVFCLLLSIFLYGVYPAPSNDEGKEDSNEKLVSDQIKEIFEKAAAYMQEGFKKCTDEVEKTAQGSWTTLGDSAKEKTDLSLQKVEELMKMMKSHMDDAMKEGHDNFQKMVDKAKKGSEGINTKAGKGIESMMDKAKKIFKP